MSDYEADVIDPETAEVVRVRMRDNYFGSHRYGVQFPDGAVLRPEGVVFIPDEQNARARRTMFIYEHEADIAPQWVSMADNDNNHFILGEDEGVHYLGVLRSYVEEGMDESLQLYECRVLSYDFDSDNRQGTLFSLMYHLMDTAPSELPNGLKERLHTAFVAAYAFPEDEGYCCEICGTLNMTHATPCT